MKVKDLIKGLKMLDQNAEVVLSSDEEGNDYHLLYDFGEALYVKYDGVYPLELTEEMKKQGYGEEDIYPGTDGIKAVVLYPG